MAALSLQNIHKTYGTVPVIADLSIEIGDRELVVFVGPSGCGKSTLIRMIAGLEDISAGQLLIDGERMNDVGPADRGLAMVFQSYALYPHMTVRQNMSFALRLAGVSKAEQESKVAAAARILHLEPYLDRKPGQLSGGQRQRVAIGRAIVRQPKAFLFDEPLSNLDAALRDQMRVEIARLHAELSVTMIYVTHDQVEAMTLADRIVVLRDGRVEQVGTPMEIYRNPANLFVAGFMGSPRMNLLPARIHAVGAAGATVELYDKELIIVPVEAGATQTGDTVTLGIRPADLRADDSGALTGAIDLIEHLGAFSLVHVTLDQGPRVTVQMNGNDDVRPRQNLRLAIATDRCHLFDATGRAFSRGGNREVSR